jgi:hypothetical protein
MYTTFTEAGSILPSPRASKLTLKSIGELNGVSASGEINFTEGPRDIPRVAKVPEAAGKAASLALIRGAADTRLVVDITLAIKKIFVRFITTPD